MLDRVQEATQWAVPNTVQMACNMTVDWNDGDALIALAIPPNCILAGTDATAMAAFDA